MVSKPKLYHNPKTGRVPLWPSELKGLCPIAKEFAMNDAEEDYPATCKTRGDFIHDMAGAMVRSKNLNRGGFSRRLKKQVGKYLWSGFYKREWNVVKNCERQMYDFLTTNSFGKRLQGTRLIEKKLQIPLEKLEIAPLIGPPSLLRKYEASGKFDLAFDTWIFDIKTGKKLTMQHELQVLMYALMRQAKKKNAPLLSAILLLGGKKPIVDLRPKALIPHTEKYERRKKQLALEIRKNIDILEILAKDPNHKFTKPKSKRACYYCSYRSRCN